MNEDVIQGIRARVEQCRRLAAMINHPEARETLLQMASDGEADIKRLAEEREQEQSRRATHSPLLSKLPAWLAQSLP